MHTMREVRKKIAALQEMNTSYWKEIRSLVSEMNLENNLQVISYFTYSLSIAHEPKQENFCLGSFHIHNLGTKPLTNPYICIKVSAASPFEFSGKYTYKDSKQTIRMANAWERINDPSEKEEFWLKPTPDHPLEPSETLSFSNFQVKWQPKSSYTGSILGFVYGEEIKEGVNSLNHISINGKVEEGDNDD
ncbi:hypothetical protein [Sediminibacillus massiliensis]|uniref:hypothetical protein n=1 Tax=Sediminibacillus massiliensis TaxID=1926277 RepID=UPI00098869AA|nr:hypothetical protein [Sediminibacillus massiliensis]